MVIRRRYNLGNRDRYPHFGTFQFPGRTWNSRGNLGQHLRFRNCRADLGLLDAAWFRALHTFGNDEIKDSIVASERGELVRGSDPPLVYSALTLRPVMCGGRRSGFC